MAGTPKPIGRILIIPKGNYDPSTPYNSLDLVRYDSKSWLCKTDGIIGITPTEGTDWTLMTEDGTDGTDGRGIVNIQRTGTDPSNPLKDIYTITYTDGTTSTFTVTNGSGGGTTADTMLKSVYDTDDDGIVDKADTANTSTNATDATNAKNLKKSDGTIVDADTITTKLSKVDTTDNLSVELAKKIYKPASATDGQVLTYRNNEWVADDSQGGGSQYVIIVKGEFYEGQTVTATKGTKSKSAIITSGVTRIPVDEGGVWTLTLSSGETWNTPNMIYYGEYEVALVPNGSTVTPTNDIQAWLKCANLNKSYTTISQVLADTNTLSALISDNNASDYMVRSTTWASDVCSNESAMTYIGLNNYCANKLLDNSTWFEAICNAKDSSGNDLFEKVLNVKVPTLTGNTGSDGGEAICSDYYISTNRYPWKAFDDSDSTSWCNAGGNTGYIGYKFPKKVCVNKLRLVSCDESGNNLHTIKDFDVYGSDDGTNWGTPIYSGTKTSSTKLSKQDFNINNNKSYLYYKVQAKSTYSTTFVTIGTVQFYGREEA